MMHALGYVEKGRERFYDDNSLIGEQVDLSLKMGKADELLTRLSEDIEYDMTNEYTDLHGEASIDYTNVNLTGALQIDESKQ